MDTSSDIEEECQLYTRAAHNVMKNRKQFTAKLEDFENLIRLDKEEDDISDEMCSDSILDVSLNENNNFENEDYSKVVKTRRNLRSSKSDKAQQRPTINRKRAQKTKTSKPVSKKRKSSITSNISLSSSNVPDVIDGRPNVIALDDIDNTIYPPIEFNGITSNISLSSSNVPDVIDGRRNVIVLDDTDNTVYPPIQFNGCNSTQHKKSLSQDNDLSVISITDDLSDDEDEPVIISIEWSNGKLVSRKQFELRKYQKFESIFDQLASIEGLPKSRISLMRDFKNINPIDTPDSLNLKYYAGLTGSVSATDINYASLSSIDTGNNHEAIKVKLVLESQKALNFTIMKHQKMNILYKKCSEELKCDESIIKLTFDGDYVDPKDVLSSLDVEDGDIFNVYLKLGF